VEELEYAHGFLLALFFCFFSIPFLFFLYSYTYYLFPLSALFPSSSFYLFPKKNTEISLTFSAREGRESNPQDAVAGGRNAMLTGWRE
jgi:hypothetical protein